MSDFTIDGIDLLDTFNVKVLKADGLDIIPIVKKRDEKSWPEESGVEVDPTTELVFEAVDINLSCYVEDTNFTNCNKKVNAIINLLSSSGYHILNSKTREKLYPILFDGIVNYQVLTRLNASRIAITFTVKLRLPMPELRLGSATVLAEDEVSLNAETGKDVTVWWGDGSISKGIGLLEHTYDNAGTYKILIAGTGVTTSVFTTGNIDIEDYYYIPE